MKNRTSVHRGKKGSAKHNDHDFMDEKKNVYRRSFYHVKSNEDNFSLERDELNFYEKMFSEQLNKQNEKYIAKRNYKRCKTMEEFYSSKRYQPTEEILQYGNAKSENIPDKKTFIAMVNEYEDWKISWSKSHGNHLHVLDWSGHFDETTPHAHERSIWSYIDEDGVRKISQEKSMELSGLELPDPDQPEGRHNNRGMTWTKMCREKWQDICEAHGFEVERKPLPVKRKNETVEAYQARVNREYFGDLQAREERLMKGFQDLARERKTLTTEKDFVKSLRKTNEDLQLELKKSKASYDSAKKTLEALISEPKTVKAQEPIDATLKAWMAIEHTNKNGERYTLEDKYNEWCKKQQVEQMSRDKWLKNVKQRASEVDMLLGLSDMGDVDDRSFS